MVCESRDVSALFSKEEHLHLQCNVKWFYKYNKFQYTNTHTLSHDAYLYTVLQRYIIKWQGRSSFDL